MAAQHDLQESPGRAGQLSWVVRRWRRTKMPGFFRRWARLPQKARALFVVAAVLVCAGAGLLAERLYFRATASRVEGTVIGQDRKGRPVVEYWWEGRRQRHQARGPSEALALSTTVSVFVRAGVPSAVRLDGLVPLLFTPGWVCIMPATFFAIYGVVVAVCGARRGAEPGTAPDRGGTLTSQGS